jgi:hypothetical protein
MGQSSSWYFERLFHWGTSSDAKLAFIKKFYCSSIPDFILVTFLSSPTVLFSHFSKIKGDNLVIILFSSLLVKTINLGHVFI